MSDKTLVEHDVRLDMIERRLEKIEQNQGSLLEDVARIREKIFNGYSERLEYIYERIKAQEQRAQEQEQRRKDETKAVIDAAILENHVRAGKWVKAYAVQVICAIAAVGALTINFIAMAR